MELVKWKTKLASKDARTDSNNKNDTGPFSRSLGTLHRPHASAQPRACLEFFNRSAGCGACVSFRFLSYFRSSICQYLLAFVLLRFVLCCYYLTHKPFLLYSFDAHALYFSFCLFLSFFLFFFLPLLNFLPVLSLSSCRNAVFLSRSIILLSSHFSFVLFFCPFCFACRASQCQLPAEWQDPRSCCCAHAHGNSQHWVCQGRPLHCRGTHIVLEEKKKEVLHFAFGSFYLLTVIGPLFFSFFWFGCCDVKGAAGDVWSAEWQQPNGQWVSVALKRPKSEFFTDPDVGRQKLLSFQREIQVL